MISICVSNHVSAREVKNLRYCVTDDVTITDSSVEEYKYRTPTSGNWNGYSTLIVGYTEYYPEPDQYWLDYSGWKNSVKVVFKKPHSDTGWSLMHHFSCKNNTGGQWYFNTYYYIKVEAPTGVSVSGIDKEILLEETIHPEISLTGDYPPFQGNGSFYYEYISSDPDVAEFSSGTITPHNTGRTTLTVKAYAKNTVYGFEYFIGEYSTDVLVVDSFTPTNISISAQEVNIMCGDTYELYPILTPEYARTEIEWATSDESVVSVNNGIIKAESRGNAVVTATTSNGLSAKCYVSVLGEEDFKSVCLNGIYYDFNRNTHLATVVSPISSEQSQGSDVDFNYIQGDVTIPESVNYYGISYTVTEVGQEAFKSCKKITSISMPQTIEKIGDYAFSDCSLPDIPLPDGLKEIGEGAFSLSGIESILIGPNMQNIGGGAFYACKNLKAVYLDNANRYFSLYNDCLYDYNLTKLYYVPFNASHIDFSDKIESIEPFACYGLRSVKEIDLPNSLKEIGVSAFSFSELEIVKIGNGMKIIDDYAFHNAPLEMVCVDVIVPPSISENTFNNFNACLVVPKGRIAAYKKDQYWGKFNNIVDDIKDAGIEDVGMDNSSICDRHSSDVEIYNLQGLRVTTPQSGIFIVRKGSKVERIVVR